MIYFGQNMSVLQAYLNQEVDDERKFNEVKFMIKKVFEELDTIEDPYQAMRDLIRINENFGVKININRSLPQDIQKANIFFEIIREAVTNAVKHADSNQVNIEISEKLEEVVMIITNNGKLSKEKIIENEGIKGMRRKLKKINGELFVITRPKFSLKIIIKNII